MLQIAAQNTSFKTKRDMLYDHDNELRSPQSQQRTHPHHSGNDKLSFTDSALSSVNKSAQPSLFVRKNSKRPCNFQLFNNKMADRPAAVVNTGKLFSLYSSSNKITEE